MYPIDYSYNIKNRITSLGGAVFSTKSLDFDGTDDFVSIYDGASGSGPIQFAAGDDFSISAWIKTTSASATNQIVSFRGTALIWFSTFKSGANIRLLISLRDNSSNTYYLASYNNASGWIASDTWTNVMCTRNGTSKDVNLYINGVAAQTTGTDTTSDNFTSYDKLSIGNDNYGGGRYWFDGNIDEVAIYSSDQSGDAATIYGGGTPPDLTSLNPTAWYRMGENSTFKETQILMPENTNKDKVSNYSMAFDGVDDNIDCGDFSAYDNGDLSCSFWIYRTTSTSLDYLISNTASSSKAGFDIIIDSTERLKFRRNTRTKDCVSGWYHGGITVDNWYHIAVTYDEGLNEGKIYVNAVLKATTAGSSSTNSASTDLKIGSHTADTAFFTGNIDEVAIFDSVLSAGDVTAMYNLGQPTDLTGQSGLVSWWRMGEEAILDPAAPEWTIPDQVGSNDGISANMDIYDRTGDAPDSSNNALSYNMDAADIDPDTP